MITAGLDTGTTTGIAVLDGDRLIHAEAARFVGDTDGEIFTGFRKFLLRNIRTFGIESLGIEEPLRTDITKQSTEIDKTTGTIIKVMKPMSNMRTFLRLYGFRGHAVEICEALKTKLNRPLQYREINSATWRSVIYSGGRPPQGTRSPSEWWKEQALARCRQLRWNIQSKDAAEAAMIAEYLRITLKQERLGITVKPDDLFGHHEMTHQDERETPF